MEHMDDSKVKNTQTLGQFSQVIFQFPKKSIQILLSISALSILVSCTQFLPLFSHCISSNFYVQLFSYTTDRNCMFLFCNGILAFLITNSARAGSDSTNNNPQNIKQISVVDHRQSEPESAVEKRAQPSEGVEEVKDEEPGRENKDLAATAEEDGFLTAEEEEEEGIGLLSTEELNKKCEDFIRKVREGIKIEAQTADHVFSL